MTDSDSMVVEPEETEATPGEQWMRSLHHLVQAMTPAHTVEQVCQQTIHVLSHHLPLLSFAQLYLVTPDQNQAHQMATMGIEPQPPLPLVLDLPSDPDGGPLVDAASSGRVVWVDLASIHPERRTTGTPLCPASPPCLLMPLQSGPMPSPLLGFLVLGLRTHQTLDGITQRGVELVGHTVAAAIALRLPAQGDRPGDAVPYKAMCDQAGVGVSRLDLQGKFLDANPRFCTLVGRSLADLRSLSMADITHAEDGPTSLLRVQQMLVSGHSFEIENRYVQPDGSVIWGRCYVSLIRDPQGQPQFVLVITEDITAYKQTETALRDSEEWLRLALQAARMVPWIWDASTDRLVRSGNACEVLGIPPERLTETSAPAWSLVHPEDRSQYRATVQAAIASQGSYISEFRIIRPDTGATQWMEDRGQITWNSQGQVVSIKGTLFDISDRKQVEQALRRNEAKFRRLIEANMFGVALGDFSGRLLDANDALLNLIGYPREALEAGQLYWANLTPPEWLEWDRKAGEELRQRGVCKPFEKEYIHRDGHRVPILIGSALLDEPYDQQEHVLTFYIDLTDLKQTERTLRHSEQRYRYLAEALPQLVWIADARGHHDYVNQYACDYIGLSPDQLQTLDWDAIIHPDDRAQTREQWWTCIQSGTPYEMEYRIRRHDGTYRWHLARSIPLKGDQGQVVQWVGVCTDIHGQKELDSQRARLLEQEQAARAEAETANRIKDEFLAVLSHELRSPLNPIVGWAQLLRQRPLDQAATHRALEIIERNAKIQAQLIEDLLDVSRILRGKLSLNQSVVNLGDIIQSSIDIVRLAAESKAIDIQFWMVNPLPAPPQPLANSAGINRFPSAIQVMGDVNRLQQVVWNLLSNAVKFTPDGGRVEVRLEQYDEAVHPGLAAPPHPRYAQITVADTGKGIAPSFLPHVFDYFRQADSSTTRRSGGLGLGLAIVRHLVELHGGTVQADSPGENQGATFTVRIPLFKAPPTDAQRSPAQPLPMDASALNGLTILVIDDDESTREFLGVLLTLHGAEIVTVSSAAEALEALEHQRPAVMLSDIGMPQVDGYQLMRQIRQRPPEQGGQIPAIALTAYAGDLNHQQAIAAGFQRHLSKPVDPDALVEAILACTGIHKS